MANAMRAKDVELYVFKILDTAGFTPESRANDKTLLQYLDDAVTAVDIGSITKISSKSNEFTLEPTEDETETKNYYGSTSDGAQNSETFSIPSNEVNVTFNVDSDIQDVVTGLALNKKSNTHASRTGYEAYNLGARTTNVLGVLVRIKRLIGSTYYYRNVVMTDVAFLNAGSIAGSPDDAVLTNDYTILSNKTKIELDMYNSATNETSVNFT